MSNLELSDGNNIPQIGVSAFRKDSPAEMKECVKIHLRNGIRYFEISELFCNGHMVMEALAEEAIPRSEVFLSFKLWPKSRTPDQLVETCKSLIEVNKFGYVDLILLHAPIDPENRFDQWKALEVLKHLQLVNILGACNITINHLMTVLKDSDHPPAVFELEVNPFCQNRELVDFCLAGSIAIISQDPLAKGVYQRNKTLRDVADSFQLSIEELMYRWSITKGFVSLYPPNADALSYLNPQALLEPLPPYVMEILDTLDPIETPLLTSWAPEGEEED